MPSTYTLNNGIELIATGEQSGTWGDTTNTNFELLDTSLDGQVTVTLASTGSSGSPNTLPVSDGAASNGRNRLVIFDDSSDLGGTAFVQLTPNDAEKIIYVRNSLSGSRSILLFQGTYSASNDYEVPAGTTAVVFFNGAGAGAVAANVFNNAHFDALNIVGNVEIGGTSTFNDDVTLTGASYDVVWDKSDNALEFADNAKAIFGAGSDLQIYHDGSDSYVKDNGDGDLYLQGAANVRITNTSGQKYFLGQENGEAQLYYGGAEKLATKNTGVDITGTAVTDGLTSSGVLDVDAEAISQIKSGVASDVLRLGNDSGTYVLGLASGLASMDLGASDNFRIRHSSVESFRATPSGVVLNEISNSSVDFRVESDTNTHALFVDAGNDKVVIGGSSGSGLLTVSKNQNTLTYLDVSNTSTTSGTDGSILRLITSDVAGTGTTSADIVKRKNGQFGLVNAETNSGAIFFHTLGSTERMRHSSGETSFNESGADIDFRVESDGNANMLLVDAGDNKVAIGNSSFNYATGLTIHANEDGGTPTSLFLRNSGTSGGSGARIHAGYVNTYGAAIRFSGNPSNARSSGTYFERITGDGPTYATSGEFGTTGIFKAYEGAVFNENGNDRDFRVESDSSSYMLFVDASSDRIGVYNSTPSVTLDVGGTIRSTTNNNVSGTYNTIAYQFSEGRGWGYNAIDDAVFYNAAGTTPFLARISEVLVNTDSSANCDFRVKSDSNTHMLFVDASADSVLFGNTGGPSSMVRINHDVDGGETAAALHIQGAGYVAFHWLDSTAYYIGQNSTIRQLRIYSGAETAGVALTNGSTSWGTFSDERLKYDIENVENAVDTLSGLRCVKYRLKDVDGPDDKKKIGLVAQDLVGVLDEVIDTTQRPDDDTDYMAVRYTEIVPVLIKAIQEQQALIETLEARITALENA